MEHPVVFISIPNLSLKIITTINTSVHCILFNEKGIHPDLFNKPEKRGVGNYSAIANGSKPYRAKFLFTTLVF